MEQVKDFDHPDHGWLWRECELRWINNKIKQAQMEEREACASVCDELGNGIYFPQDCAAAIRARSNE